MSFLIGLLTVLLVLNCIFLILLVLVQLPKKEAGAGIAFGGGAADALFGAGTGNVLTKTTKYATIVFFALALLLGWLQSNYYHSPEREFRRKVQEAAREQPLAPASAPAAQTPLSAPSAPSPAPTAPAAAPAESSAPPQPAPAAPAQPPPLAPQQ
ncbi:MAG: preprotein translocase subunit SecG [Verrucomicrobiales bacterium]|nr:preprotein translocase subunit SecG [Verrucomicrobiales bacterium]